jgi:hypothetical protein
MGDATRCGFSPGQGGGGRSSIRGCGRGGSFELGSTAATAVWGLLGRMQVMGRVRAGQFWRRALGEEVGALAKDLAKKINLAVEFEFVSACFLDLFQCESLSNWRRQNSHSEYGQKRISEVSEQ